MADRTDLLLWKVFIVGIGEKISIEASERFQSRDKGKHWKGSGFSVRGRGIAGQGGVGGTLP